MPAHISCPSCEAAYSVDDGLRGKKVRCKKCGGTVPVPSAGDAGERARPDPRLTAKPGPARRERDDAEEDEEDRRAARPPARGRRDEEDAPPRARPSRRRDDGDDRPRRGREAEKGGGSAALLIGLIGGGVTLLLLVGGLAFAFWPSGARPNPPGAGAPQAGGGTPPAAGADPAADLYAEFTEEVLPAEGHGTAPLRPRKTDAVYKIANPRIERGGPSPFPRLVVDYERVRDGAAGGVLSLVIRPAGKRDEAVRLGWLGDRAGRIEAGFRTAFPFAQDLPALENCEYYLTVTDQSYGAGFHPTFKASNSALVGNVRGGLTRARAWSAEEAARLRKPAPRWPEPNRNGSAGQDTPFAGDPAGAPAFRFAEPGRPLIGLEWNVWTWGNQKCLAHVYPIYERDMPLKGIMPGVRQEVARPGYAVGGLVVKATKLTHAMQVVYMKLRPDGTLDPADSYTSDWLGNTSEPGATEAKLGADGQAVIGVDLRGGAVVNAVALVMGGPPKK